MYKIKDGKWSDLVGKEGSTAMTDKEIQDLFNKKYNELCNRKLSLEELLSITEPSICPRCGHDRSKDK